MIPLDKILIKQVLDEMVKFQPSLSNYFITDEEEGEPDYRVLGHLLIRKFPWPIGVELRRLFSGAMNKLDRLRLDQLFKTVEKTMQFISFVMLSQAVEEKIMNRITLPDTFKDAFQTRFKTLSMGNFTWLIRSLGNLMNDQNIEWFMPEMRENFTNKFYAELDSWVPGRNEIGHYQFNLTQDEIEMRSTKYQESLIEILKKLAFLAKYKLVSVKGIMVLKSKNQEARFHHVFDLLNSTDSDFKAQEIDEKKYCESNSVLLMKTIKSIESYLNLSPLLIDTSTEIKDSKEKFNIKKDIFMYTKFYNDQLSYVGTEVTEKCDLRSLSNYPVLVDEFKEILSTMS
jgi:hypothetical protein